VTRQYYSGSVTSPATAAVTYPTPLSASGALASNVTVTASAENTDHIGGVAANSAITINLTNASVTGLSAGDNVSSWFNPIIGGLSYTVTSISNSDKTVVISVTGIPTATSSSTITLTIPAAKLLDSNGYPSITSNLTVNGTKLYSINVQNGAVARIGSTYYTTLSAAISAIPSNGSATIYVVKNIDLTASVTIPASKTVTLVAETDGLTIKPTATLSNGVFIVARSEGASLILGNTANTSHTPKLIIDGNNQSSTPLVRVNGALNTAGSLAMYKGAELRNSSSYGVGLFGYSSGGYQKATFNMYGGVIAGCSRGVYMSSSSTFTMTGGIIYGNDGSANANTKSLYIEGSSSTVTVLSNTITAGNYTVQYGSAP